MLTSNSPGSYERQTSKEDTLSSQVTDSHFPKRFLRGVRAWPACMTIASANRHCCICPRVMWGCKQEIFSQDADCILVSNFDVMHYTIFLTVLSMTVTQRRISRGIGL